ncbi:glycerol-3-phosphate dehydrogenase/oxidase [Flavobacteriaceae bacterium]|nr:glycerol-3-phosphate dehydrogenase/oxidase [Flavobacteriaceae bacterium]MDA9015237.1 glycerol-3-phosphate dehydrogenase/oxidase [Flavobacteriaceae bacterium]MDA9572031.1 glycerol-3-phosphate dehydrogenase/oxidase [Flavobacteriaceae bacterium]MDB3862142.1 glycerol-3-phosphate dehydrogenase/oxidase [Flavobacteriaceae bacterium]
MNRAVNIKQLELEQEWDVIIIGGGASGLGIAVDSANRGYKTLLLEKHDFAKGTSSRSTKLVHGGVRYLQNGDISLVIEALRERGIMRKNAPHLVRDLSFVIPSYEWWTSPFYGIGLKVYDMMAGKLGLGPSTILNREETLNYLPNVNKEGLQGGVIYHDGQFDDTRMAISLALTADQEGATLLNYVEVSALEKVNNMLSGVQIKDRLDGSTKTVKGKVVINATGVFSDKVIRMDKPDAKPMIRPSQGVHLVIDKSFLQENHAIMVPHTTDGRVLFAVPWNGQVVIGTTDTPVDEALEEPLAMEDEIDFILENASAYMTKKPSRKDVKSVFAGLRPLAANNGKKESTKEVSRHHKIIVSTSGLISVLGGKWTTYRKIAEDAVNTIQMVGGFPDRKCNTETLAVFGNDFNADFTKPYYFYGTEIEKIRAISPKKADLSLSEELFISENQIIWAVREEMAMTVEDVLARRTRCLFLDAYETEKIAPKVAEIMRKELRKDARWVKEELKKFDLILKKYQL